jgi:hypothetical protein
MADKREESVTQALPAVLRCIICGSEETVSHFHMIDGKTVYPDGSVDDEQLLLPFID